MPSWLEIDMSIHAHLHTHCKQRGYIHIIKVVIDPPFVRVVAIPCRHIDRKGIAQAVSPIIRARVCTAFTRIGANRNVGALVRLGRSIGWIAFLTMLYGRLGIAWLL